MSKAQALVALGVLAFLSVGAGVIGLIVYRGGDPDQVIRFLSNSALPIAVGLVTLSRVNSTDKKQDQTRQDVATVKQQTNGAMSRILDRLDALERNESTTLANHGDIPQQGQETRPTGRGSTAGGS